MIQLSRLRDREDALRHSRAKGLIDRIEVERHRHRACLVGARVEKLAVQHDGDGNQASLFARRRKLDQPQCPRTFVDVALARILRQDLRREWHDRQPYRGGQGDGEPPITI